MRAHEPCGRSQKGHFRKADHLRNQVKFFTLDRSIAPYGGRIIHRHHGKRAHADDERALIDAPVVRSRL